MRLQIRKWNVSTGAKKENTPKSLTPWVILVYHNILNFPKVQWLCHASKVIGVVKTASWANLEVYWFLPICIHCMAASFTDGSHYWPTTANVPHSEQIAIDSWWEFSSLQQGPWHIQSVEDWKSSTGEVWGEVLAVGRGVSGDAKFVFDIKKKIPRSPWPPGKFLSIVGFNLYRRYRVSSQLKKQRRQVGFRAVELTILATNGYRWYLQKLPFWLDFDLFLSWIPEMSFCCWYLLPGRRVIGRTGLQRWGISFLSGS